MGRSCPSLIMATKVQKVMTQPINLIFRFLQNKSRIQIMLYEHNDMRIEGRIIGFDEYMNLVLDDAEATGSDSTQGRQHHDDDEHWQMTHSGVTSGKLQARRRRCGNESAVCPETRVMALMSTARRK